MNDVILISLIVLNILSIAICLIFYFKYKTIRDKFNKRPDSYDTTELMHDLIKGNAIVEIRRVDPASIFKRML